MTRFEPRFHRFVAAELRYKSVKTRFETEHFSSSYGRILILAFGQIFIFFYKSYFLRIFFLVVGIENKVEMSVLANSVASFSKARRSIFWNEQIKAWPRAGLTLLRLRRA